MQDPRYDELREILGANAEKGIDERFKELLRNNERDIDEMMEIQNELEPKYVIVKHGHFYEFRAKYTDMHRSMLSSDEIRYGLCDGGGFWGVDGEKKWVTLYDSSSDFGRPKHIEKAIKQSGRLLLEILGRVCDKSGVEHDLSDYTITYMDAVHVRHIVEPPYDEVQEPESDIKENGEGDTREALKRLSREDYERFGRCTNYTPPSTVNKKKRKAKNRQQKQSRKRSRR